MTSVTVKSQSVGLQVALLLILFDLLVEFVSPLPLNRAIALLTCRTCSLRKWSTASSPGIHKILSRLIGEAFSLGTHLISLMSSFIFSYRGYPSPRGQCLKAARVPDDVPSEATGVSQHQHPPNRGKGTLQVASRAGTESKCIAFRGA